MVSTVVETINIRLLDRPIKRGTYLAVWSPEGWALTIVQVENGRVVLDALGPLKGADAGDYWGVRAGETIGVQGVPGRWQIVEVTRFRFSTGPVLMFGAKEVKD